MSSFSIQFQNARTNWEWQDGILLPDDTSMGVFFNDEFVVPDVTFSYPFYTWTNFRILCSGNYQKINLWADVHSFPDNLDPLGRKLQEGDANSTYADYRIESFLFKNSNRFYFWIDATNKDDDYVMAQNIFDPHMDFGVSKQGDLIISANPKDIPTWLGWNPRTEPSVDALEISSNSPKAQVARWIMGWDNTCVNVKTNVLSPTVLGYNHVGILDTYDSIKGLGDVEYWLSCASGKYFYGKILYSLEDHDFVNHRILSTEGFKSCQISVAALEYGY